MEKSNQKRSYVDQYWKHLEDAQLQEQTGKSCLGLFTRFRNFGAFFPVAFAHVINMWAYSSYLHINYHEVNVDDDADIVNDAQCCQRSNREGARERKLGIRRRRLWWRCRRKGERTCRQIMDGLWTWSQWLNEQGECRHQGNGKFEVTGRSSRQNITLSSHQTWTGFSRIDSW